MITVLSLASPILSLPLPPSLSHSLSLPLISRFFSFTLSLSLVYLSLTRSLLAGTGFATMMITVIFMNQLCGPTLFKHVLEQVRAHYYITFGQNRFEHTLLYHHHTSLFAVSSGAHG
jgi:hypothetical protein